MQHNLIGHGLCISYSFPCNGLSNIIHIISFLLIRSSVVVCSGLAFVLFNNYDKKSNIQSPWIVEYFVDVHAKSLRKKTMLSF